MGRESFIIYTSFYKPISKLSDKQLGRLFRAIFRYQLDGVVEVEEDIEMAFAFFVNQFEIDESKYQCKVERNRENGRKGGAPKGNRNAVKKTTETTENNPTVENITETTRNNRKVKKTIETSLNDNENDNDIELSSTTSKRDVGEADHRIIIEEFLSSRSDVEAFCMSNHISPEELRRVADEILVEWKLTNQTHPTKSDAKRHLINQIRIKLAKKRYETNPKDRLSKRRGADSAAISPEDYSESI